MSGRGKYDHCHGGNIPDINHADCTTSLASVERVLRPDRARVVVDQILHKTVGPKKRVGQTRGLNVSSESRCPLGNMDSVHLELKASHCFRPFARTSLTKFASNAGSSRTGGPTRKIFSTPCNAGRIVSDLA